MLDTFRLPFKSENRSPHHWCFPLVPRALSVKEHTGWSDDSSILRAPCSRCYRQNIEIQASKWVSLRLSGFPFSQFVQKLSKTCQPFDFLTRVNECFWTTLEKQNYKRHIWESALKTCNCQKMSGMVWQKALSCFQTADYLAFSQWCRTSCFAFPAMMDLTYIWRAEWKWKTAFKKSFLRKLWPFLF